jgi:hypothetical protein
MCVLAIQRSPPTTFSSICTTQIQAKTKGLLGKKKFQQKKKAAITIQSSYRGHRTRKELKAERKRQQQHAAGTAADEDDEDSGHFAYGDTAPASHSTGPAASQPSASEHSSAVVSSDADPGAHEQQHSADGDQGNSGARGDAAPQSFPDATSSLV